MKKLLHRLALKFIPEQLACDPRIQARVFEKCFLTVQSNNKVICQGNLEDLFALGQFKNGNYRIPYVDILGDVNFPVRAMISNRTPRGMLQ